jgi:hypothetical protein
MVALVLIAGWAVSSFGNHTAYAADTTIHVKGASLDDRQGECDGAITLWHFVITLNGVDDDGAPDSIHVFWDNGTDAVVLRDGIQGNNADYTTTTNGGTGALVTDATAVIDDAWKGQFNLSHVECTTAIEELSVSKTVETSYTRTHSWEIEKKVETENGYTHNELPKVWLYTDGSGDETATWTVDVDYDGFEDSDFNVSGTITVENSGTLDATINTIDDVMAGTPIDVSCTDEGDNAVVLPYLLPVGATITCAYNEAVDIMVGGDNVATVTTESGNQYGDTQPIVWGDPATETNKTVNVSDLSGLFGSVDLGSVTAPNGDEFIYTKDFAWADYGRDGCGDYQYDNTATIDETGQSADASLLVNVQCMIFHGETAWAANGNVPLQLRYTTRGNWATYVQYQGTSKSTTLFAGQTNNAGTVSFSTPVAGKVTITVQLTGSWNFADLTENLMVQGYASAPSGNPAPGQFANKTGCNTNTNTCQIVVPVANYYGVHVNVGTWTPDPNFGP